VQIYEFIYLKIFPTIHSNDNFKNSYVVHSLEKKLDNTNKILVFTHVLNIFFRQIFIFLNNSVDLM